MATTVKPLERIEQIPKMTYKKLIKTYEFAEKNMLEKQAIAFRAFNTLRKETALASANEWKVLRDAVNKELKTRKKCGINYLNN